MTTAFFLAISAIGFAAEAVRLYLRDRRTRTWSIAVAEVIETVPDWKWEREGLNFNLLHSGDFHLRWYVDGFPYFCPLEESVSINISGWVIWHKPLSRKPRRVRYDPADPSCNLAEARTRDWRYYGSAAMVLAIAAITVYAL
jgi:hypothetical protein